VTFDDFDSTLVRARWFESIAAYQGLEMTLGSGPQADTVAVTRVSPRFFEVLRGRALEGRLPRRSSRRAAGSSRPRG
jgi:hypothetical protein